MANVLRVLRTFASKPFVVVTATGDILGSSGNMIDARALALASKVGNDYRIVDLCDFAGFRAAALEAGDKEGARVARIAMFSRGGKSRRRVAEWILEGAVG